jgi:hypothetical protein
MTESEFLALGRAGFNRIPLHLETLADLDTPLSIYLKLANRPGTYLLESVIGGERFGRYSIVGLPARERLEVSDKRISLTRDGEVRDMREMEDPLVYVDDYLASFAPRRSRRRCVSRAASPGISAMTPCATLRLGSEGRASPIRSRCRRSVCCSRRSSRSSTTSPASCTSSCTPILRARAHTARPTNG